MSTPAALEAPSSDQLGAAMRTMPASPATRPVIWRPGGRRRTISAATIAVKIGVAPFNMPVTLEETRCSARGNSDSGTATHTTPSSVNRGHAADHEQPEHDAQPRHEERFERLETFGDQEEARTPDQARHRQRDPVRECKWAILRSHGGCGGNGCGGAVGWGGHSSEDDRGAPSPHAGG